MKITCFFFSVFCFFIMQGCAQAGYGIKKSEAFYKISIPGALQVDDNGNPMNERDTVRVVYLETNINSKPIISRIVLHNKSYTAQPEVVQHFPEVAGMTMNNEKVTLQPAKGNSLWKMQLVPDQSTSVQAKQNAKLTIEGTINHKPFTLQINRIKELQPDPHY